MANGILEAKIDQIQDAVIIQSIQPLTFRHKEWKVLQGKLGEWRARFEKVESILEV